MRERFKHLLYSIFTFRACAVIFSYLGHYMNNGWCKSYWQRMTGCRLVFLSNVMFEKGGETELMLNLSISVILEWPATVCDFLSSSPDRALQVKPVHTITGAVIFLLPLMSLRNHKEKSHCSDTTTLDPAHTVRKTKGRLFWCMLFWRKRGRKKTRRKNGSETLWACWYTKLITDLT